MEKGLMYSRLREPNFPFDKVFEPLLKSHSSDYVCKECKYLLKNGGTAARELCPIESGGCGALNSFISVS